MKKLILLLALAFVMCGCYNINQDNAYKIQGIMRIDSCEYVVSGYRMAHKGNCKYCTERRKKEQEELIRKIKENE